MTSARRSRCTTTGYVSGLGMVECAATKGHRTAHVWRVESTQDTCRVEGYVPRVGFVACVAPDGHLHDHLWTSHGCPERTLLPEGPARCLGSERHGGSHIWQYARAAVEATEGGAHHHSP